jgi:predicted nucleic acid-binding protein
VILVDTSVWIDHFRRRNDRLVQLLSTGRVLVHPFVIGELACGQLGKREETLSMLRTLRPAPVAEIEEVLAMIERLKLYGTGLGYLDMHLIASARLARRPLWSLDKLLVQVAFRLGVAG